MIQTDSEGHPIVQLDGQTIHLKNLKIQEVKPPKGLTPFQLATIPPAECDRELSKLMAHWEAGDLPKFAPEFASVQAMPRDMALYEFRKSLEAVISRGKVYLNNVYQVMVDRPQDSPMFIHLSVKRRDKGPIRDWRHMQWIKNVLVGPEHEGVELYPAESRVVDSVNQYHMWVFAKAGVRFPFGYHHRAVTSLSSGNSVQRPFEE